MWILMAARLAGGVLTGLGAADVVNWFRDTFGDRKYTAPASGGGMFGGFAGWIFFAGILLLAWEYVKGKAKRVRFSR